jgi:hypothetical protein
VQLGWQSAAQAGGGGPRAVVKHLYTSALLNGSAPAGPQPLLLFAMPHHRSALQSPDPSPLLALTAKGVRGNLRTVAGAEWTLTHELPALTWSAPAGPPSGTYAAAIAQQLVETDVNSAPT